MRRHEAAENRSEPASSVAPGPVFPSRVLFFLEPFPVRGRPLDFQWVLDRWRQAARGLEQRGIGAQFATSVAIKEANPDGADFLCPRDLGLEWVMPEGAAQIDAAWVRLMTDPDEPTWRGFVDRLLDQTRPDAVVTWTMNAPLSAATRARGIVLMHQELGPLRLPDGPLYFCDPRGVNGASAILEVWPDLASRSLSPVEAEELKQFLEEFFVPPPPGPEALAKSLNLDPGKRTLAVFLQVSRDSNVLVWSRVKGNQALLRAVSKATTRATDQVVVKAHPFDPDQGSEIERLGFLRAPIDVPSRALLEVADVVLTVNSSVGFEAIARGKRVLTFGASPYSGLGCTIDLDGNPKALRQALSPGRLAVSDDERQRMRRLVHFFALRYLATDVELTDPDALVARIRRWRALADKGAPLVEYFEPERATLRMRELRSQQQRARLRKDVHELGSALQKLRGQLPDTGADLAQSLAALATDRAALTRLTAAADELATERDRAVRERDAALRERDAERVRSGALTAERAAGVHRTQAAIGERDAALERARAAFCERDVANGWAQAALRERDAATERARSALEERNAAVDRVRAAIDDSDAALARAQAALADRDMALARAQAAIAEQDTASALANAAVADRDAALAQAQTAAGERYGAMAQMNNAFEERDAAVRREEAALAEREAALARARAAQAERDAAVFRAAAARAEAAALARERDAATNALRVLRESLGVQALERVKRLPGLYRLYLRAKAAAGQRRR